MNSDNARQLPFDELRWADISVADVDSAKSFYANLFGWHYGDTIFEGRTVYSLAFLKSDTGKKQPVAGIAPLWDGQMQNNVPAWHVQALVESADRTVERVLDAGGVITMPQMDVMDAGRMAICCDSLGNSMALWQPYAYYGAELMKQPGTIAWFELITDSPEQASEFYSKVFGWVSKRVAKQGADYWMLYRDQALIGGMQTDSSPTEGNPHWLAYFCVEDIDACLKSCVDHGGRLAFGPVKEPEIGEYAVVADNQNQRFGLVQFNS